MPVKHRTKVRRYRGSRTHGWGVRHRGSGQRGGRGNAGSGKRADCQKPSHWERVFGRNGFKMHGNTIVDITINLHEVDARADAWIAAKQASAEGGVITVDLSKLGYTKLLGTGRITRKMNISVKRAAASCAEKVAATGGKLTVAAE